jgi:hypothetical protein
VEDPFKLRPNTVICRFNNDGFPAFKKKLAVEETKTIRYGRRAECAGLMVGRSGAGTMRSVG